MLLHRERALEVMDEHGLDALVATTPVNVYYLSDYGTEHSFHFAPWGLSCAILPRRADLAPTLIVQEWEVPHVSETPSWMPELRVQTGVQTFVPPTAQHPSERRLAELWDAGRKTGHPNRQRLLGATLRELGLDQGRLAIDDMRVATELAENELADATLMDGVNVFREIRIIKTPAELALLARACRLNQTALEGVASLVDVGVTCREIRRFYRVAMEAQGAYGSHITGGGTSHPWISYPDMSYRYQEGDIIHLDPAGHFEHYWADLGRTAVLGEPSARFQELYAVLQECHDTVDPLLVVGQQTGFIREQAALVTQEQMPSGFLALVHSIGIEQYDHPQTVGTFLSESIELKEGMTVNFETLYFELGWGMLQLEDTYHITATGPRRLATLAQEPFVCPMGRG